MPASSDRTRDWARLGAKVRLAEIERERAAILAEFPDIAGSSPETKPARRLSPAARKKLSEGMRRYWAKRKAGGKA
jgi:hypothetical protein